MAELKILPPEAASEIIDKISKEWMLIGVKDGEGANAMTASWGMLGFLWYKPVCICFIRPQRYTFGLAEKENRLSLSFFGGDKHEALSYCGTKSGRDHDKLAAAGLGYQIIDDVPVFDDAKLTLVCRKLYSDKIKEENMIDLNVIEKAYPNRDYHKYYICEIEKCIVKE